MAKVKTKTTIQPKSEPKAKPKAEKPANLYTLTLTQETIDKLAATVRRGNFRYVARGRLGIPEGTFKSWTAKGRRDLKDLQSGKKKKETMQARLVTALEIAESEAHSELMQDVLESDNVKVKADFMYRRYGKLYSRSLTSHDDETGETTKVDPMEVLAETLKAFIKDDD